MYMRHLRTQQSSSQAVVQGKLHVVRVPVTIVVY